MIVVCGLFFQKGCQPSWTYSLSANSSSAMVEYSQEMMLLDLLNATS
jgi:hypothetical protein